MKFRNIAYHIGNAVDDLKSIVAPHRAATSKYERRLYFGYEAGTQSRADLPFTQDSKAEQFNSVSRGTLRARARDAERNSPIAGSLISACVNNIVGTGFNFQARSDNDMFNARIEDLWNTWCSGGCDYTETQTMTEILEMIVTRMLVDGGIIILFPYDKKRQVPMTMQIREVDDFDETQLKSSEGNDIVNGVELTPTGKPVAYYLHSEDPDGTMTHKTKRIPVEDALFLWHKTRPSQYREITPLARTLIAIKDLTDYNHAVTFQQKMAACVGGFVETDPGAIGPVGRPVNRADGTREEGIKAGSIKYLRPGEKFRALIPSGQAAEVGNYFAIQQRAIAADLGLSLESTARNVERVNYSSARQNLLADAVTYKRRRQFIIDHFLKPVYRRFVQACYLAGLLNGVEVNLEDEDTYRAVWLAPSLGWIDPKKEAEADNVKLANGGLSYAEYCASQGADWRERIDEMAEVQAYAKAKGVQLQFVTDTEEGTGKKEEDSTDEDEVKNTDAEDE